jgi:AcrR family transcriptional regulator
VPAPQAATHDRIRLAALEAFARDGVEATSIRDVATAAGVSPGLVQHYFPSKADLRAAVNAHVTDIARTALETRPVEGDVIADISARLTALVADNFTALRYVARGVGESDDAALAIFDALTQLCRDQLTALQRHGLLREGIDLEWAALHTVLINLATVMLEPGISRQLSQPFLTKRQVQRWKDATTALFTAGELSQDTRWGSRPRTVELDPVTGQPPPERAVPSARSGCRGTR